MATLLLFKQAPASAKVGMIMVLIMAAAALLAPVITPYSETEVVGDVWAPAGPEHWIGTDNLGRDLLTRLVYGARNTIALAFDLAEKYRSIVHVLVDGNLGQMMEPCEMPPMLRGRPGAR